MGANIVRLARLIPPAISGLLLAFASVLSTAARAADDSPVAPLQRPVETALLSLEVVGGVLIVLILIAVAIIVYRKALAPANPAESSAPPQPVDPMAAAAAEERRGNYAAAAARYEAIDERLLAAECWEKIKDFARAAESWEAGGDLNRAAQAHVRSGSALRAAGLYMQTANYIEAAKIFRNKGDHLRAAQALEAYGNRIAAAREYTEAGNHAYAASLLEQERLYAQAAAAYAPLLGGDAPTAASADHFGTYAALLSLAGETERAVAIYRAVLEVQPGHPRAQTGLRSLTQEVPGGTPIQDRESGVHAVAAESASATVMPASAGAQAPAPAEDLDELAREIEVDAGIDNEDPLKRVFTLRSMIRAGRMEPRYGMRLWVQVMRSLAERHAAGGVFGCLTPDAVYVDMQNNVRIEKPAARVAAYLAPEVLAGQAPDRRADIFSMGVILFELVGGPLAQFGKTRAGEVFSDVPPWLDELIARCTAADIAGRFGSVEEVSAALLKIKNAPSE